MYGHRLIRHSRSMAEASERFGHVSPHNRFSFSALCIIPDEHLLIS
jgi:hypothetical protein